MAKKKGIEKINRKFCRIAAAIAILFLICTGLGGILGGGDFVRVVSGALRSGNISGSIADVFGAMGVFAKGDAPVVLIDAGHGGIDGGAVSADGVSEKDINLNISILLKEILKGYDIDVQMTREEDKGLYTGVKNDGTDEMEIEGKRSIRSLKAEDLNVRRDMADAVRADAFVSVHLNSYRADRSVFGAQTFYTTDCDDEVGERSRNLAEAIQKFLISDIDNGNERAAMKKNDVLIMKNAGCPTVIVECGFLSNASEARLLESEDYQQKLAEAISRGILEYLGIEEKKAEPDKKDDDKNIVVSD